LPCERSVENSKSYAKSDVEHERTFCRLDKCDLRHLSTDVPLRQHCYARGR